MFKVGISEIANAIAKFGQNCTAKEVEDIIASVSSGALIGATGALFGAAFIKLVRSCYDAGYSDGYNRAYKKMHDKEEEV